MRPRIFREGSQLIALSCYARGDGYLGFTAYNVETTMADPTPPTLEECKKVCPYGWIIVEEGNNYYAKPV